MTALCTSVLPATLRTLKSTRIPLRRDCRRSMPDNMIWPILFGHLNQSHGDDWNSILVCFVSFVAVVTFVWWKWMAQVACGSSSRHGKLQPAKAPMEGEDHISGDQEEKVRQESNAASTDRSNNNPSHDHPPKATLGLQVLHDCDTANIDIVAVHGLGANPDYAWVWNPKYNPPGVSGYPDQYFNWLKELLPRKLACRVLAFNYNSRWFFNAPQQRISNISDNLLGTLQNYRYKAVSRPLIFIGHSFGGNIIEQAIVSASRHRSEYLPIAESTVGVVFLGTPHRGCRAAKWGAIIASLAPSSFVAEDRVLRALQEQSDSLTDCLRDFSCWLFSESVPVICAFEKFKTNLSSRMGFMRKLVPVMEHVVPEHSACIDGHRKISLDTDHFKINKFYGSQDPSFKSICSPIVKMADTANEVLTRRRNPKPIPRDERFTTTSSDLQKCLQKMRVTNPLDILLKIKAEKGEREEHTCKWILKQKKFSIWWASQEPQALRLIGSPGIGKTIMSTFLVELLKNKVEKSPNKVLAYFFCNDQDQDQSTPTSILRSLVWQLLLQRSELFEHLESDWKKHTNSRVFKDLFSNFFALWRIFQNMLLDKRAGQVFILIDALDECDRSSRQNLLHSIEKLFRSSKQSSQLLPASNRDKFKFFITCRPEISDIEDSLNGVSEFLMMGSREINDDLCRYIDAKVDEIAAPRRPGSNGYPDELKEKVRKALKREADGTFLWVSLMVADLKKMLMHQVGLEEWKLPHGLDKTYAEILGRIPSDRREAAQFILSCMVAARRPLKKREIETAFATWDRARIPPSYDLVAYSDICSACSSIIYMDAATDDNDATLYFCHKSVKDFLLDGHSNVGREWYHTRRDSANLVMFQVCWRYLNTEAFNHGGLVVRCTTDSDMRLLTKASSRNLRGYLQVHFFLAYAWAEWEYHALMSCPALLGMFQTEFREAALQTAPVLRDAWLLRTAQEGQYQVLVQLLERGADPTVRDARKRTPLSLAAENGHMEVVKLLLKQHGVDPDTKGTKYWVLGRTPLSFAAENGHDGVVKMLLGTTADVNLKDSDGRTPMSWAAENGHEEVVKVLLDKTVDMDLGDAAGRTALSRAAENGHLEVIKLLLRKSVDVGLKDLKGRTALSWAVEMGHGAVVQALIEGGGDPEDSSGQTLLSSSAREGHMTAVRVLLENGADINAKDKDGWTALHQAAMEGHDGEARLLIEAAANVNEKTERGETPLHMAAQRGHDGLARLLIQEAADVNAKTVFGGTALLYALENGHGTMSSLLQTMGAHAALTADLEGTTFHNAALMGHEPLVKAFLAIDGVDINELAGIGWATLQTGGLTRHHQHINLQCGTALLWAASNGHEGIVKLLLGRGADVNVKTGLGKRGLQMTKLRTSPGSVSFRGGITALLLAASNGHAAMVTLLLENGADTTIQDDAGRTALYLAASHGHVDVVRRLLEETGSGLGVKMEAEHGWNACLLDLKLSHRYGWNACRVRREAQKVIAQRIKMNCGSFCLTTCRDLHMTTLEMNGGCLYLEVQGGGATLKIERLEMHGGSLYLSVYGGGAKLQIERLDIYHGSLCLDVSGGGAIMQIGTLKLHGGSFYSQSDGGGAELCIERLDLSSRDSCKPREIMLPHEDEKWCLAVGGLFLGCAVPAKVETELVLDEGKHAMLEVLSETGMDAAIFEGGLTPLHAAARNGHEQVVRLLLAGGADVNAKCGKLTALHLAAKNSHKRVVQLLVESHADVEAKDGNGKTPRDLLKDGYARYYSRVP